MHYCYNITTRHIVISITGYPPRISAICSHGCGDKWGQGDGSVVPGSGFGLQPLFYYTVSLQNCQTSFFGKKRIDKKTIVQDEQILI